MENEEEEDLNKVHNPSYPQLQSDSITNIRDSQEQLQNTPSQFDSVAEVDGSQLVHGGSESPPPPKVAEDGGDVIAEEVNQVAVGGGESPPPQSPARLVADEEGGEDVIAREEKKAIERGNEWPPPPMVEGGDESPPPPPTVFGKDGEDVIAGKEKSSPVSGGESEDAKAGEERTGRQAVDREMEMETTVAEAENKVAAMADTVNEVDVVANLAEDTVVTNAAKDTVLTDATKDMVASEVEEDGVLVETTEEETVVADVVDAAKDREVADMAEEMVVADMVDVAEDKEVADMAEETEVVGIAKGREMAEAAEETTEVAEMAEETEMTEIVEETNVAVEVEMEVAEGAEVAGETEVAEETEVAREASRSGAGKRKRGKNSKAPAKIPVRKTVGEDVCFICFDGGELVLCDRRGCPKAYHPSCVNRDEAFFRAKGRWNCGWHLCSVCEKNAHYMCYTCTFSLCKGCIKDAVIFCVRGNKGFCETCMKTVMLIEKNEQGNKEMSQVDFDDKSSWEYLFKDYWVDLKGKLSLTLDELSQAKNPWKGLADKQESSANNDGGLDSDPSFGKADARISKRRKVRKIDSNNDEGSGSRKAGARISKKGKAKKQLKLVAKEGSSLSTTTVVGAEGASKTDTVEWASKELLEFVLHMKDGDKSVVSQFDVQALLLEYIKRNKLRDPRRKSQIICDSRLENLFGKPRVGHFEMLKLLESHFLVKEDSQADDLQGSVVDTEVNPLEADGNRDALVKARKDKRRKTSKKGGERGSQSNHDDYAAIDMHNINLIYLRRNLVEDLIEDTEQFHDRAVGSFVRIRISGSGQKQDLYRLVQVVGTSKAAEPYKVGKRMTNIVLEILNLNKTEVISIDIISNQEFTEDECKRLRQSIKCGLIDRMTVGDLQEKAMAHQGVRVKDVLETEVVRLSHLCDRASDLGRRKELRECVEKLQLLRTPEEKQRRLEEIPEIHADPNMDPNYESEEEDKIDDKKQENYLKPRGTGFSGRGMEPVSPRKGGSVSNDSWGGSRAFSSMNRELSRNLSNKGLLNKGDDAAGIGEIVNENSLNQGKDREAQQSNSWEKPKTALISETGARNSHSLVIPESFSGVVSETSPVSLAAGVAQTTAKISETDKMWHYRDPSGKVQGPFSMVQLRKWCNTGYFPTDLRIWRTNEKQDDSILLTDALTGKFKKEPRLVDNGFPTAQIGQTPNLSSSYSGKPYGTPLQLGKEGQSAGVSWRLEPDGSSSKGRATPSVNVLEYSTDGRTSGYDSRNDSTNLPSPTPSQSTAGGRRGQGYENKWSPNPFSVQPQGLGNGVLQPHISLIPESGQMTHSSALPSPSIKPSGGADGSNVANVTFGQQATVPRNKEQNRTEYLGVLSGSNSGGQLVQGSENDHSGSLHGASQAPRPERGVLLNSTNAPQNPSLTTSGESHTVQGDAHQLLASDFATALLNPGADIIKNSAANLQNLIVSMSKHNPHAETHGWGSASVPKPEAIATHQIPGSESQGWGGTPPQKTDSNNPNPMPAQQPAYGHRGDTPSSVPNFASSFATGNSAGIFATQGFTGLPLSDPWRPPVMGNQSNIQPPAPPNLPWGTGVTDNSNAGQRPGADNQNPSWGSMPENTNMGWRGPVPGNGNMNWTASGQGPVPGNIYPGWTAPGQGPAPGNTNPGWAAPGQGPMPGNANPGWVAPGQGPMPGNANQGWVAPGQGPMPGNGNPGWVVPGQGPMPGNTNSAWVAPTGNPGMWGSEQSKNGDRISNQRDRGCQGGDSGYGGGRPWNRQPSFGSSGGGPSRPSFNNSQRVCKYHANGHCKKGASCDHFHN